MAFNKLNTSNCNIIQDV